MALSIEVRILLSLLVDETPRLLGKDFYSAAIWNEVPSGLIHNQASFLNRSLKTIKYSAHHRTSILQLIQ